MYLFHIGVKHEQDYAMVFPRTGAKEFIGFFMNKDKEIEKGTICFAMRTFFENPIIELTVLSLMYKNADNDFCQLYFFKKGKDHYFDVNLDKKSER